MIWHVGQGGTIIDLACGTGRLTIPLAEKGFSLLGVDLHRGMLQQAQEKAAAKSLLIDWVQEDCTKLQLGTKSKLIYSVGNSFQHFLTNEAQDGFFHSVRNNLETGGILIFGTRFPSKEELIQPSTEEFWRSYIDEDTNQKVDLYTISSYDAITQVQHYITTRKYQNEIGEIIQEHKTTISLRYTYPQEMERMLSNHGFEIVNLYQDWNGTPLTQDSYEMIYLVRKS
ncbi:2-methoxy-6-polyprenyl-1,4-benzoquinol methylase, mitochondrial [Sutcliffiella rhizosphaerae]|uniref:2-methoxy-6-polyprenyl-1,4-benzoquinol methylase, mitochondrial n=1 Tax=Sutcliffiella rhizosphaerae TaxID=2880967 RepID=A0ABM8YMK0_9BACI|nr:2-methoxy-6-polyprenyl-1,4-benzoquinol methylase, mitochondrial [Sutcliffiella rhizosphaerae]